MSHVFALLSVSDIYRTINRHVVALFWKESMYMYFQGNYFRAGPEKLHLAQKFRIIFQRPEFKKKIRQIMGIFTNVDKYIHVDQKSVNFIRNCVLWCQESNLRPTFTAARKNIFGKVVTLYFYNFPFPHLLILMDS